jgi:nitroimidazol reductase NimA-like FMN-containing flavoprotein (pyridoxamine 5'-phosphate oxidase superfamily)
MPRESISMSMEEVTGFLQSQRWMVLGTLAEDGTPWADVVACLLDSGFLYFCLPRGSRSLANISRDNRVCLTIDQFPSYYEIKGVTVHGRAQAIPEGAAVTGLASLPDPLTGAPVPGRAVFRLDLADVMSFDFGKIKGRP